MPGDDKDFILRIIIQAFHKLSNLFIFVKCDVGTFYYKFNGTKNPPSKKSITYNEATEKFLKSAFKLKNITKTTDTEVI